MKAGRSRVFFSALALFAMGSTFRGARAEDRRRVEHVLLLSVDGLHEVDLAKWVESHPSSVLARLRRSAVNYRDARTTTPSDSFPGLLARVTGGTPRSTGVYYDDSYDRTLFPPGSNCSGSPGSEIVYDESVDFDVTQLFSGGMNPANLPLAKDAAGCHPVRPHSFLKVNTIFEVVKAAGRRTAWSDKHPTYDLVNGPSGAGVDDLYTPEINSNIANGGVANGVDLAGSLAKCDGTNSLPVAKVQVYTDCIPSQEAYDDVKVQAVLNWIDGKRSDGSPWPRGEDDEAEGGAPAIFGMNFQAVSVGEKLPVGGYRDAAGTPSANLAHAIAHTDRSIGRMVAALAERDLLEDPDHRDRKARPVAHRPEQARHGRRRPRARPDGARALADRRRRHRLVAGPVGVEHLGGGCAAADERGGPLRHLAPRRHHLLAEHQLRSGAGGDLRQPHIGGPGGCGARAERVHPA